MAVVCLEIADHHAGFQQTGPVVAAEKVLGTWLVSWTHPALGRQSPTPGAICPDRGRIWHELAERHGYRLVFTVIADAGPILSGLIVAQHICEHDAEAVVVPGCQHAEAIRTLVAPTQLYPRGFRWLAVEFGRS